MTEVSVGRVKDGEGTRALLAKASSAFSNIGICVGRETI